MTAPEYIQLKAFARQDGALLALLWVSSFLLYIIGITNEMLGMAAFILMIYTPIFVGSRLGKFRDFGLEGLISFRRGYAYSVLVFFYGGVLFALALYGQWLSADAVLENGVIRRGSEGVAAIWYDRDDGREPERDVYNSSDRLCPEYAYCQYLFRVYFGYSHQHGHAA